MPAGPAGPAWPAGAAPPRSPRSPIERLRPGNGDPADILASPPVSNLLAAFLAGGADGVVIVCGTERVRTLLGTCGVPGILPLVLARCAQATLAPRAPLAPGPGLAGASLFGLSAFVALPEEADAGDGDLETSLPVLDVLDGFARSEAWELCAVETFTDVHKVFAALVRVFAGVAGPQSGGNVGDDESVRRAQTRFVGRWPLVFRIALFTQEGAQAGFRGFVAGRALLLVDAPPAIAGGPVPSAYRSTIARLRRGSCCVLHASGASAADTAATIRSALGPLHLVLDENASSGVRAKSEFHKLQPLCAVAVLESQAHVAKQDLSGLVSMWERRGNSSTVGALGSGSGSMGVPATDLVATWRSSFSLREVTIAEVTRQIPLARSRIERLRGLLRASGAWTTEDDAPLQQLMGWVGPDLAARNAEIAGVMSPDVHALESEVAALAWQRQWQAQELLGRLGAAEDCVAFRNRAEALERDLHEASRISDAAVARERSKDMEHEATLAQLHDDFAEAFVLHAVELAAMREQLETCESEQERQCDADTRHLADLGRELDCQRERSALLESRLRVADEVAVKIRGDAECAVSRAAELSTQLEVARQRLRQARQSSMPSTPLRGEVLQSSASGQSENALVLEYTPTAVHESRDGGAGGARTRPASCEMVSAGAPQARTTTATTPPRIPIATALHQPARTASSAGHPASARYPSARPLGSPQTASLAVPRPARARASSTGRTSTPSSPSQRARAASGQGVGVAPLPGRFAPPKARGGAVAALLAANATRSARGQVAGSCSSLSLGEESAPEFVEGEQDVHIDGTRPRGG